MSDANAVDYDGLIPNNVGLNSDPRVKAHPFERYDVGVGRGPSHPNPLAGCV